MPCNFFRRRFRRGVKNLIRWFPIIWCDADWDWAYLAVIMETKLRQMVACSDHWIGVDREVQKRQMTVCYTLLERLRNDEYYDQNAMKRFGDNSHAWRFANEHAKADQRYLGLLLGKYMRQWWD